MFADAMISSDAVCTGDRRRPPAGTRIAIALACLALTTCAASIKRDLSAVPVGQVGYDDMCGLQTYFDAIAENGATAPAVTEAADVERQSASGTKRGGRARFAFETDLQLATVRHLLDENWKGLPPGVGAARHIELDVSWSERAGVRRVANDSATELVVDGVATSLPYHVCLSELLFGEPLYGRRRAMLARAPQPASLALEPGPRADAGAPDVSGPLAAPETPPSSHTSSTSSAPTSGAAPPTITGKKD